jgi:hypothetical protein
MVKFADAPAIPQHHQCGSQTPTDDALIENELAIGGDWHRICVMIIPAITAISSIAEYAPLNLE